jgi:hypothetical protein
MRGMPEGLSRLRSWPLAPWFGESLRNGAGKRMRTRLLHELAEDFLRVSFVLPNAGRFSDASQYYLPMQKVQIAAGFYVKYVRHERT